MHSHAERGNDRRCHVCVGWGGPITGYEHPVIYTRARIRSAASSSMRSVPSQPMQASVIDTP